VGNKALVIKKEASQMEKIMKQQYPVYFISKVLARSKKYYSEVEKIILKALTLF
jgi:hypothetical protein